MSLTKTIHERRWARLTGLIATGLTFLVCGCAVQTPQYWGGVKPKVSNAADTLVTDQPQLQSHDNTAQSVLGVSEPFPLDSSSRDNSAAVMADQRQAIVDDSEVLRLDEVSSQLPDTNSLAAGDEVNKLAGVDTPERDTSDVPSVTETTGTTPGSTMLVVDTISVDSSSSMASLVPQEERAPPDAGVALPRDSDGDGVPDIDDLCRDTPTNAEVDSMGCPSDEDADGVYDGIDQCPGTPEVVRMVVNSRGCPADDDGDGVPDYLDYCLGTPQGREVTRLGCPPDRDGDGVADIEDHCPDTPKGLDVDSSGCLMMTQLHRQLTLRISQEPGTSDLDRLSQRILDDLANRLAVAPGIVAVIKGFTDDLGQDSTSLAISRIRVKMIAQYLSQQGIDKERIKAFDGDRSPSLADNPESTGQSEDFRIEISFYSDDE